jgi:hypothetical protein
MTWAYVERRFEQERSAQIKTYGDLICFQFTSYSCRCGFRCFWRPLVKRLFGGKNRDRTEKEGSNCYFEGIII